MLMDFGLMKVLVIIAHHGVKNVFLIPFVLNSITSLDRPLSILLSPPTCQQLATLGAISVLLSIPCSVSSAMMDST